MLERRLATQKTPNRLVRRSFAEWEPAVIGFPSLSAATRRARSSREARDNEIAMVISDEIPESAHVSEAEVRAEIARRANRVAAQSCSSRKLA
jgi:hypothetical protein